MARRQLQTCDQEGRKNGLSSPSFLQEQKNPGGSGVFLGTFSFSHYSECFASKNPCLFCNAVKCSLHVLPADLPGIAPIYPGSEWETVKRQIFSRFAEISFSKD